MKLVQITRDSVRRVGLIDNSALRLLDARFASIYALAQKAIQDKVSLVDLVSSLGTSETLDYGPVYEGKTEWRFLPAFDHPADPAHCLVSGTGLTHKASAKNRAAMHKTVDAEATDSFRMFKLGLEGGSPARGEIGVQPEWFYKGNGTMLKGHLDALTLPAYGDDGGEEPEVAGIYTVGPDGEPYRIGYCVGNEFSDHVMEKKNYLYLAPSKLRECAIGPELTIGDVPFENLSGEVSVRRDGKIVWSSQIWTGQANMSHSVANLEHHHFKYPAHRQPGDVHVHFFGADAFSFGEGIALEAGDLMQVSFPDLGRPLRNFLTIENKPAKLATVRTL
ncbi:MAG: AraD1 family protein [Bryobacteraceae bacterium]